MTSFPAGTRPEWVSDSMYPFESRFFDAPDRHCMHYDKAVLTPEVMGHYRNAQPRGERAACAALPGHIIGASDWLDSIWRDRAAFADKPALLPVGPA